MDTSFGTGGFATTVFGSGQHSALGLVIQSDGKIVAAGGAIEGSGVMFFAVARYKQNGSPDTSFGSLGRVATAFEGSVDAGDLAYSVNLSPGGKIVAAGRTTSSATGFDFGAVRYNLNGSLDNTFGVGGKVATNINRSDRCLDSLVQPDGKIVLVGDSNSLRTFTLARYNLDGSLDGSFGNGGIVAMVVGTSENFINAVTLPPDGKIIAAGESGVFPDRDITLIRYNPNGSVDPTFGTSGKVVTAIGSNTYDIVADIVLQRNGRIVIAGSYTQNPTSNFDSVVIRYLNDNFAQTPTTAFDFDGDRKTDISIFRPSTGEWFVLRSEDSSFFSFPFGSNGDIPAPADYDGDGKADPAVYRPSSGTWFISNSGGSGTSIQSFGIAEDKPVPADYDGDGKADIASFRPSVGEWWYSKRSTGQTAALQFGQSTDKPVPGDYTGDGKADIAFFSPGTGEWFILRSEDNSFFSFPFGASGDIPAAGDYDGDGRQDAAVFRPSNSTWFANRSTAGILIATFGTSGDLPAPGAFVP